MLPVRTLNVCKDTRSRPCSTAARAAAPRRGTTPLAAPALRDDAAAATLSQHIQAQVAFTASLEKVVGANRGSSTTMMPQRKEHQHVVAAQLALQSSSAARLQRQTHLNTLNMSSFEEEHGSSGISGNSGIAAEQQQQQARKTLLPLSQLAFKALLRASLAAARLHHGYVTTPHLLLGLISAGSTSLAPPASTVNDDTTNDSTTNDSDSSSAASLAAAAEAAVVRLIDGPVAARGQLRAPGAAAAASLLGRSCGLDVVQWVPQLSGPAKEVLLQAEELRQAQQGQQLLTSHHLLAALLRAHAHTSDSKKLPAVQQLLQELGFDVAVVAATAAAAGSRAGNDNNDDDAMLCEPLGFLHEEFYSSLCAELLPNGNVAAAAAGVPLLHANSHSGAPCLN